MFAPIKVSVSKYIEETEIFNKTKAFNLKLSDIFETLGINDDGIIIDCEFINIDYLDMLINYNNYELFNRVLEYGITNYYRLILTSCINSRDQTYIYKCIQFINKNKINTNLYTCALSYYNYHPKKYTNYSINIKSQLGYNGLNNKLLI